MAARSPVPIPPPPTGASDDEEALRLSLLDVVYGQAWVGAGASPIAGVFLCAALWRAAEAPRLVAWLAALLVAMLVRYAAIVAFRRRRPRCSARGWEWVFVGSLTFASLTWGLGSIYVLPAGSAFHKAVVFSFLIGMAGGAALIYAAHKVGALASLYSIGLPMTVVLGLDPDQALRFMAVGGVLLMILGTMAILRLGGFIGRSFELSLELAEARRVAEQRAQTDDLTGLYNRGAFYEMGEYLIAQAARRDHPLSVLVVDVDDFKRINDRHGHAAGDAVLRSLAVLARACFRDVDVVARVGGDEFGVLLPEAPLEAAVASAERLRTRLRETAEPLPASVGVVTCSMGVATHRADESLDDFVARADAALYRSKQAGRDRVSAHGGAASPVVV